MVTFTTETVRRGIREYILANHLFTDDESALDDDESFQASRIVDSMGMMQIIQFLEARFHITVQDHEMAPEHLDSVNRIVRLIARKREAA